MSSSAAPTGRLTWSTMIVTHQPYAVAWKQAIMACMDRFLQVEPKPPGSLGELVASLRKTAGMTQEELAGASGLSVRSISDLERDRITQPRRRSLELLAAALDLDAVHTRALIAIARGAPLCWPDQAVDEAAGAPLPVQGEREVPLRYLPGLTGGGFVGRLAELRTLKAWLDGPDEADQHVTILAIVGAAGVGKTTLALRLGHQIAERFPDGQLWVNLRGFDPAGTSLSPAEAVRTMLDALGMRPGQIPVTLDAQVGLYRSLVAGRRILVVLDNVRDASQVRPILPSSSQCLVITTSRSWLLGLAANEGARVLNLDVLPASAARRLLAGRLGKERLAGEPEAADELIRLCAGLPLALGVAAARMSASPGLRLADLASQMRDTQTRLDVLDAGDPASSVRAAFFCSYQQLPPEAARMFQLLGLHHGPDITALAASTLAAIPLQRAHGALSQLVSGHLLSEWPRGRYWFHDLLRAYAQELAGPGDTRAARRASWRMLTWYLHTAAAASQVVNPTRRHVSLGAPPRHCVPAGFASYDAALQWLESERVNLLGAVRHAAALGEHEIAWKLAVELWDLLDMGSYWADWIKSIEIGIASARRLEDWTAQGWLLNHLAIARQQSGNSSGAIQAFREALDIRKRIGDRHGTAVVLANLGRALSEAGRLQAAVESLEQALAMSAETGNLAEQGRCHYLLSETQRRLSSFENAATSAQLAVDILRQVGNEREHSGALVELAFAKIGAGDPEDALAHASRAAEIARGLGDRQLAARTLAAMSHALLPCGRPEQAQETWRQAREIFTDLGDPHADDWLRPPA